MKTISLQTFIRQLLEDSFFQAENHRYIINLNTELSTQLVSKIYLFLKSKFKKSDLALFETSHNNFAWITVASKIEDDEFLNPDKIIYNSIDKAVELSTLYKNCFILLLQKKLSAKTEDLLDQKGFSVVQDDSKIELSNSDLFALAKLFNVPENKKFPITNSLIRYKPRSWDDLCGLIQALTMVPLAKFEEYKTWADAEDKSKKLYLLPKLLLEKKTQQFFIEWQKQKDDYPLHFWTVFFMNHVWKIFYKRTKKELFQKEKNLFLDLCEADIFLKQQSLILSIDRIFLRYLL